MCGRYAGAVSMERSCTDMAGEKEPKKCLSLSVRTEMAPEGATESGGTMEGRWLAGSTNEETDSMKDTGGGMVDVLRKQTIDKGRSRWLGMGRCEDTLLLEVQMEAKDGG